MVTLLSPEPVVHIVRVQKKKNHPWKGKGFPEGYIIDEIEGKVLLLERGKTYLFAIDVTENHPFYFTNDNIGGILNQGKIYNAKPMTKGLMKFTVDNLMPSLFYYQCYTHASMGGVVRIRQESAKLSSRMIPLGKIMDPTQKHLLKVVEFFSEENESVITSYAQICDKKTRHPKCEHSFTVEFFMSWLKNQKRPDDNFCLGCHFESLSVKRKKPQLTQEEREWKKMIKEEKKKQMETPNFPPNGVFSKNPKIWLSLAIIKNLVHNEGELVKITELYPFITQDRSMEVEKNNKITETFELIGFYAEPIIINYYPETKKAWITEGHHRLLVAKGLKLEYVPVTVATVGAEDDVFLPCGIRTPYLVPTEKELHYEFGITIRSRLKPTILGFTIFPVNQLPFLKK